MRSPAALAQRALLLEVAATPTPGNVDREHDLPDLRFDRFLAGASGARAGLDAIALGSPLGEGFEQAIEGMAAAAGTNTQFGALLVLAPMVRAAASGDDEGPAAGRSITPADVEAVVDGTTVDDAAAFYRAFEHVSVRVDEPPEAMDELDVRRGAEAVPDVRERGLTLADVLAPATEHDDVAREWTEGFERSFGAAERLLGGTGPLVDRAAAVHLDLLAERPDTLVETKHGEDVAADVAERAAALDPADEDAVRAFAAELCDRGINPGTTADILAGGLFLALLDRGGAP